MAPALLSVKVVDIVRPLDDEDLKKHDATRFVESNSDHGTPSGRITEILMHNDVPHLKIDGGSQAWLAWRFRVEWFGPEENADGTTQNQQADARTTSGSRGEEIPSDA